jgi:DNA (cytosine-5)-methyltransferase 1
MLQMQKMCENTEIYMLVSASTKSPFHRSNAGSGARCMTQQVSRMYSSTTENLTSTNDNVEANEHATKTSKKCELQQPLNCIDLFAGAGGFSLAAQRANLRVVAAVEMDEHACSTYSANLIRYKRIATRPTLYPKDILDLKPEVLRNAHFNDGTSCDIVLGGPPCQGFSVHRIKGAGIDDPRNQLVLRYFEFVECLQPKVFLMENVPGLLWPRHRAFLTEFLAESEKAGYRILGPVELDARDYGVPQRRKRVFVLGIHKNVAFDDSVWPPRASHGDENARRKEPTLKAWLTAKTVFAKSLDETDENNIHMVHSQELVEVFKATPINGGSRRDSGRVLDCHQDHDGHTDVYGRINPTLPGPTMTTACINPSKGRFVHPIEHHGITARHAARFQTFPDDFVFKGGITAAGKQIGNAVPVKLGEVLLRTITDGLRQGLSK